MIPKHTLRLKQEQLDVQTIELALFKELEGKIVDYAYAPDSRNSYDYHGIMGRIGEHHIEILKHMMRGTYDKREPQARVIINKTNISSLSESNVSVEEYLRRYVAAEIIR